MCDLNKIGWLIGAASAAIIVAVGFCAAAAIAAGTLYGALGNGLLMGLCAGSLGVALASINLAMNEVGGCVQGRCRSFAETLQNALITIAFSLTIAIAAVVIGIFFASIPYVGTGVCIALGVTAAAIGIALALVGGQLNGLQTCLFATAPPATGVTVGGVLTTVATIILTVMIVGVFIFGRS